MITISSSDLVGMLKQLDAEPDKIRTRRAMFLGLTTAFAAQFLPERSSTENLEQSLEAFENLLFEVNEYVTVDIKMAQLYFESFFRLRIRLLRGDLSAALLQAYFDEVIQEGKEFSLENSEHLSAITASTSYKSFCRSRRLRLQETDTSKPVVVESASGDVE